MQWFRRHDGIAKGKISRGQMPSAGSTQLPQ